MKPEQVLQYSISHRPSTGIYVYSDWSPTNEHPATTNISQAHSTWQPWSKPRCQYTVDTLKTTFPKSSREHRYRWSHNAQKKRVQVQCALTPTHPQTLRRSPNQWAKLSIAEEKNNSWRRFHGLIGLLFRVGSSWLDGDIHANFSGPNTQKNILHSVKVVNILLIFS